MSTWRASRFRRRWMTEDAVAEESLKEHRAPDATIDEVGVPRDEIGFDGQPMPSRMRNGYGTDDPNSPGWAGWAG